MFISWYLIFRFQSTINASFSSGTNKNPFQAPNKLAPTPTSVRVVPSTSMADVCNTKVCYATLKGFEANITDIGSIYIQTLCATLGDNAKNTDFSSLMTWVTDKVIDKLEKMGKPIQIPCGYWFSPVMVFEPWVSIYKTLKGSKIVMKSLTEWSTKKRVSINAYKLVLMWISHTAHTRA